MEGKTDGWLMDMLKYVCWKVQFENISLKNQEDIIGHGFVCQYD